MLHKFLILKLIDDGSSAVHATVDDVCSVADLDDNDASSLVAPDDGNSFGTDFLVIVLGAVGLLVL